jgi:hypothetical protein
MATRTESIRAFLTANTHADLATLYHHDMECQVNVAQDGGTRIESEYKGRPWHGWTDGLTTWKSFRIPRNAATNPEYADVKMSFDLVHAEGIGMTGWDWKKRMSRWVAFDFDAIVGHKERHQLKMTESELEEVKQLTIDIPWVTVRKSSGGKGLHLYVFFDPPILTQNHTEHAALARAVLGQLSALAKFDFNAKVDTCGHNMWVWHRKMKGTDGLALIKQGGALDHVPPNWRDHVKVIRGNAKRNLPSIFKDIETPDSTVLTNAEALFLELTGQSIKTPLDDEHKRVIQFLEDQKTASWWDADHHMLVTHTYYLKRAHEALQLKGIFETDSAGSEAPNDHNCYLFPLQRGAWAVRRYSLGVKEHPTWDQDGQGWTRCYYNCDPTLYTVARSKGGIESKSGAFVFNEAELALDAVRSLGANVPDIHAGLRVQRATVKPHRDGRVVVEIEGDKNRVAESEMPGWLFDKGKWQRIFPITSSRAVEAAEAPNFDDIVRHIITDAGTDYGWMLRNTDGSWRSEPLSHVAAALQAMDIDPKKVKVILGSSVLKCWRLVNRPFQPEYPGNREWNREAAQFRFVPSENRDDLKYPTWLKILEHCGSGLNEAVQTNSWCKANGLRTGADYLKCWIASLFKEPTEPLPYLFFFGDQNTGKSSFHEALSLLITRGYTRADRALTSQQGFNEELKDAILCVIEEINLNKNKDANNRIKDWVTARQIPIHPKGKTPYHVLNTTHWVQVANESTFCPIFPGDTRITMSEVPALEPSDMIPKKFLIPMLEREASDFLAEILHFEIPPSNDRLNVPVLMTSTKLESERANQTPLQTFIDERMYPMDGNMVSVAELYAEFEKNVDPFELNYWTKNRVVKEMPPRFPKGRNPKDGHHYFGNVSLTEPPPDHRAVRLKIMMRGRDAYLVPENANGNEH